jgi:type IV pilus assembly protein PilP
MVTSETKRRSTPSAHWIRLAVLLSAAGVTSVSGWAQQAPSQPNAMRIQEQAKQATATAATSSALPRPSSPAVAPVVQSTVPAPVAGPAGPRRDPFAPLVSNAGGGAPAPERLPAGKPGLIIGTLRVDGIVRGPNGMIAVVSNPQQRVYFLHEGDRLYDGQVGSITMEAVVFHQSGRDAFGTPVARDVTKRLYPIPGEQP